MNSRLKENWFKLIALVLLVFAFIFYWYSWRPSQITAKCTQLAQEGKISETDDDNSSGTLDSLRKFQAKNGVPDAVNDLYEICIKSKGLRN